MNDYVYHSQMRRNSRGDNERADIGGVPIQRLLSIDIDRYRF